MLTFDVRRNTATIVKTSSKDIVASTRKMTIEHVVFNCSILTYPFSLGNDAKLEMFE